MTMLEDSKLRDFKTNRRNAIIDIHQISTCKKNTAEPTEGFQLIEHFRKTNVIQDECKQMHPWSKGSRGSSDCL